ncbi:unnamed protein product, partial [Ascophyllum nodosum]
MAVPSEKTPLVPPSDLTAKDMQEMEEAVKIRWLKKDFTELVCTLEESFRSLKRVCMWVETVTEGGRRLMAAWRKEEGKPCAQFEHRKRRLGRPPSMKRGLHA